MLIYIYIYIYIQILALTNYLGLTFSMPQTVKYDVAWIFKAYIET